MLGPSEIIRAARQAVARYGAESVRVQSVLQTVLAAQARGDTADLFEILVHEELLSRRQAHDLRSGLDQTQVDPDTDVTSKNSKKPAAAAAPNGHAAEPLAQLPQVAGFQIFRRLGEGGMGTVYLAFEASARRQVALKVLAPEIAALRGSLDRFRREGKSGRSLNHPNIVSSLGAGQDNDSGLHYLVLEYVDGPSAHDLIERFGRLKVGDAVHIVLDVARALEHAHGSAIIHRDIKPANVLLTTAGVAKLSDLGLAKRTDEASHLTLARQGVGTPYYMPYEQALNAKDADARSDLFALGATLYHLLTGEVPFPGHNPMDVMDQKDAGVYLPARALNPEVPESLERILGQLLARKPENRYASASALIVDLERSQLAVAVPSFVDLDLALRDPLVRERLSAAAQPTSVDVNAANPPADKVPHEMGYWYLRFKDRHGRLVKAKLTQAQVLQRLREGKLSVRVDASRSAQGEFRRLGSYAEYRDIPETRKTAKASKQQAGPRRAARHNWTRHLSRVPWLWVLSVLLGAGIIALIMLTVWRLG
jgi:serine/threonine protein kinase